MLLWVNPADVTYGIALGPTQLNAQANVAGTFLYTPPAGTRLNAGGGQILSVVFTPDDTTHYQVLTQTVTITVLPAVPLIVWPNPVGITYGTALDPAQLDATANVPGTFVYTPPAGALLNAGNGQALSVTFTPDDMTNYALVTRSVPIDVAPAVPLIHWSYPAAMTNGTPLGPEQLNATTDVPGAFLYTPPAGTVLDPGSQQALSVVFTPADAANYVAATKTVLIDVTSGGKRIPIIAWANPAEITYGTALSGTQLNATANVAGTFSYHPPDGTVLRAGTGQILTVTFTPLDTTGYAAASRTVTINVAAALVNASVRVAYLIPTNRVAQSNGVTSLRHALRLYQDWFRDQMQRNGFGPKTFALETEADTVTPTIHLVPVPETDSELRSDARGARLVDSARAAGVPIGTRGQIWWLVAETHLQDADGSISGGFDLAYSSGGSGDDSGWALFGSDLLALLEPGYLTNNASYDQRILGEIGPYPLQAQVSFPWFDGGTLSSVSSAALGAGLRQLAEALGLDHDFRNDENFNGNLTGFGFRGIRGAAFPRSYPYNDTRLPYGAALALNVSPYFNFGQPVTDYTRPTLNVTTSGAKVPVNGSLQIGFSAFDPGGLSAALLSWNQASDRILVGEMALAGTNLTRSFVTPYYDPGQTNQYTISVFDSQGNRQDVSTAIVPTHSVNYAPLPFITVSPDHAGLGEDVVLDASAS
ncbi:MAG TPA: hypothetical protein VEO53_12455, partial [Candidatus Binatia bacterium]|nr:hypothetical protein [Candidatus Binatia bacterium]